MPLIIFDSCCGCIELRTGCLIIGYLSIIVEIAFMIVSVVGVSAGVGMAAVGTNHTDLQQITVTYLAISIVLLLVMLFFFTFTVALVGGIHQNKRGYVKAYLIVATVCLIISFITTLCSVGGYLDIKEIVCRIIAYIVGIYFLMVIRSYYYKMEDNPTVAYTA